MSTLLLLVLVAAMILGMAGMRRAYPPAVREISAVFLTVAVAGTAVLVLEAAVKTGSR